MNVALQARGVVVSPKVLVVEDEALIAMVLEDILDMLGFTVVGSATTLAEADGLADVGGFEIAVLDVNLGTDPVYPLADRLISRGVGVIFATGSHPDTLPERYAGCPVMEKPYAFAAVERALGALRN